jgi:RNA polymerase sigma-70 factor (ECF subfamily)
MLLPSQSDLDAPDAAEPSPSPFTALPQAEFSRLLGNEIAFLRQAVRRWHRDKADADDLVQDTLVRAFANAHLWQPGTSLRAWLYTIMRNEFLARTARSNRSASALQVMAAEQPAETADCGELRLLLRDLGEALRRLPANQRSAVLLIGVQEKSYDEAAQEMGTTVASVRCHLARGRDRLRTAIRGSDTRPVFGPRPSALRAAPAVRCFPLALVFVCAGRLLKIY